MGDNGGNSIINVGDLSKPVNTLIKKIAGAASVLYEPTRIRNVAQATADAAKIEANVQIEITDLHQRAMIRMVKEQGQHQENMEEIIEGAIPLIEDASNPETVEDDWITNFFDKCRLISDDEMQTLWSRVLAGEANQPGQYSKRTVNLLANLDKSDAVLFTKLCGFVIEISSQNIPYINEYKEEVYAQNGLRFVDIKHLENIGLIDFQPLGKFSISVSEESQNLVQRELLVRYFNSIILLRKKINSAEMLCYGEVMFTKVGRELFNISSRQPVSGFENYIIRKLSEEGWTNSKPLTFTVGDPKIS